MTFRRQYFFLFEYRQALRHVPPGPFFWVSTKICLNDNLKKKLLNPIRPYLTSMYESFWSIGTYQLVPSEKPPVHQNGYGTLLSTGLGIFTIYLPAYLYCWYVLPMCGVMNYLPCYELNGAAKSGHKNTVDTDTIQKEIDLSPKNNLFMFQTLIVSHVLKRQQFHIQKCGLITINNIDVQIYMNTILKEV